MALYMTGNKSQIFTKIYTVLWDVVSYFLSLYSGLLLTLL